MDQEGSVGDVAEVLHRRPGSNQEGRRSLLGKVISADQGAEHTGEEIVGCHQERDQLSTDTLRSGRRQRHQQQWRRLQLEQRVRRRFESVPLRRRHIKHPRPDDQRELLRPGCEARLPRMLQDFWRRRVLLVQGSRR